MIFYTDVLKSGRDCEEDMQIPDARRKQIIKPHKFYAALKGAVKDAIAYGAAYAQQPRNCN